MSQPHELRDLFHREVPTEAIRGMVRGITTAYRSSDECCKQQYDERIHHQAWGYHRWLKIDSELLAVGQRFGNVSRFESNTDQTHIGHTELHFGPLVLTAACVQARGRFPKPAKYRDMLAASNQLSLFQERMRHHKQQRKLWVAVLHVPNIAAKTPLHIHAGFIADDHGDLGFACELIDLMKIAEEHETLVAKARPALRLHTATKSGE